MQGTQGIARGAEAPASRPRSGRPNYNILHARPLPLQVYPLPPLIPHNPLSLLHIAFTYLRQLILPTSSHPSKPYSGVFSAETRSVHVTDEATVRALWECGFFGKGSLSRSEPSWLEREKRRLGLAVQETSEDVTRRRREERKEFKKERARKEREAIERTKQEEQGLVVHDQDNTTVTGTGANNSPGNATDLDTPAAKDWLVAVEGSVRAEAVVRNDQEVNVPAVDETSIVNLEHLQLTLEEAFFLAYALGVLEVRPPESERPVLQADLLPLFRAYSVFPPTLPSAAPIPADDIFLPSYVVYHHFRSLGWVVRPGVKFGVDYLLYNRGPVFSHAEFAVMVLSSYSNAYWKSEEGRAGLARLGLDKKSKSWWWLHMINRVQSQVRKTLVLAFVEIPPPTEGGDVAGVDVTALLKRYTVREMVLKRWIPNRSRD